MIYTANTPEPAGTLKSGLRSRVFERLARGGGLALCPACDHDRLAEELHRHGAAAVFDMSELLIPSGPPSEADLPSVIYVSTESRAEPAPEAVVQAIQALTELAALPCLARASLHRSYGFRTYRVLELALYHSLGKLSSLMSDTSSGRLQRAGMPVASGILSAASTLGSPSNRALRESAGQPDDPGVGVGSRQTLKRISISIVLDRSVPAVVAPPLINLAMDIGS